MDTQHIQTELQKFNVTDAAIAELEKQYANLKINGLDDKEGYNKVHEARIVVRDKRVAVEKTRKELKADSLEYGRAVDAEAKRITALLEPIENELAREEGIIEAEKNRIKELKEKELAERLNARITELAKYGAAHDVTELKAMNEDMFKALSTHHKGLHEAEQEKKRIEAEAAKSESDRIAKEKKELEEKQAAFAREQAIAKAAQDKIDAENKARQDALDKAENDRKIQIQKEKDEKERIIRDKAIADKAAADERERLAGIERDKAAKIAQDNLKAQMKAALAPDKEKILAYVVAIKNVTNPSIKNEESVKLVQNFQKCLMQCCEGLIAEANKL